MALGKLFLLSLFEYASSSVNLNSLFLNGEVAGASKIALSRLTKLYDEEEKPGNLCLKVVPFSEERYKSVIKIILDSITKLNLEKKIDKIDVIAKIADPMKMVESAYNFLLKSLKFSNPATEVFVNLVFYQILLECIAGQCGQKSVTVGMLDKKGKGFIGGIRGRLTYAPCYGVYNIREATRLKEGLSRLELEVIQERLKIQKEADQDLGNLYVEYAPFLQEKEPVTDELSEKILGVMTRYEYNLLAINLAYNIK